MPVQQPDVPALPNKILFLTQLPPETTQMMLAMLFNQYHFNLGLLFCENDFKVFGMSKVKKSRCDCFARDQLLHMRRIAHKLRMCMFCPRVTCRKNTSPFYSPRYTSVLFLCVLFCRNVTCFRKDLNDVFLCVFFFCFSSNLQISRFPRSSTRSWKIRHRFRGIWKRDPSRDRQRCSSRLQNHADECYEDYVC